MKKLIFALFFTVSTIFSTNIFALNVDVEEIYKAGKVDFTNYEGRDKKSESISQIKSIGYQLAYKKSNSTNAEIFHYYMKYHIVSLTSNDSEKYSCDIFFIDKDASVDHIKNVRRILSAYIEQAYNYSVREADSIALYLTYYNAVHRGEMDFFTSKYTPEITKYVNQQNIGISTKYYQWPGKTAIIIPLTAKSFKDSEKTIDPFAISDEKTNKEVKNNKENNQDREVMQEIKKKDLEKDKKIIEEEKKKTQQEKKTLTEEKKKIEEDKKTTETKKEEIQKEKKSLEKEKEVVKTITEPVERKKKEEEIAKKEEEIKKKEEEVKKEEEKQKKDEEILQKKEEQIKKTEEKIEKKEEEVKQKEEILKKEEDKKEDKRQNSTEIEKKAEELKKKEEELNKREDILKSGKTDQNVFGIKLYYLEVKEYLEGGHYNNALYMINASTKKIDFKSPVENICGRRYDVFSGGIVVITHNGEHKAGHKLTLIDRETLKAKITGVENIFWRSFIEIRDNNIYAIVKEDNSYYLGKFDENLKLISKSKEKLNENTFITFFDEYIYVNREDKTIIVLNKKDLTLAGEIKP
ncbi:MAG TPA: P83/100 family protein [Spirochaetota bacterium]|nr:P83/100 family protein [Spirochaetota bacterium]